MWSKVLGATGLVMAAMCGACGGGANNGTSSSGGGGSSTSSSGGAGGDSGGSGGDSGGSGGSSTSMSGGTGGAGGVAAAKATAENNAACKSIQPFYWEIGDANGMLPGASGSLGSGASADKDMDIASATKFVWGAYVVERFKDDLGQVDANSMTMRAGYASLKYASCVLTTTVDACLNAGKNGDLDQTKVGIFNYGGGHFQHYASALGLGEKTNATLEAEMESMLGPELHLGFSSPQLAAGMHVTPADYTKFLRKILSGGLAIRAHLGELHVETYCPDPAAGNCYSPVSSPLPGLPNPPGEAWHYSYGHWVEDDAKAGVYDDGAFSSPGAFGFYPWIDASRTYYGIIGRQNKLDAQAYVTSVECGRRVRRAFLTGEEVTQ